MKKSIVLFKIQLSSSCFSLLFYIYHIFVSFVLRVALFVNSSEMLFLRFFFFIHSLLLLLLCLEFNFLFRWADWGQSFYAWDDRGNWEMRIRNVRKPHVHKIQNILHGFNTWFFSVRHVIGLFAWYAKKKKTKCLNMDSCRKYAVSQLIRLSRPIGMPKIWEKRKEK